MIVLDASAALELLLNTPLAAGIADRAFADGESLHAPHLIDIEIAQVMRRLLRHAEIDAPRAAEVFTDLHDLALTRYPHQMLLDGIWTLRDNVSAYDAAYVVLSLELGATLLTCDRKLSAVPVPGLNVELVETV